MKKNTIEFLKSTITAVTTICSLLCCLVSNAQTNEYPASTSKEQFFKISEDSLHLFRKLETYGGSGLKVGVVTGLVVLGNNVYISDQKYNKIFVLDKENFTYKFSISNTEWKGSGTFGNLCYPFCPMNFGDNIVVPQYSGPNLFSIFSKDGKLQGPIKTQKLTVWPYSGFNQSCFIKDSTIFITKLVADGLTKVELLKLSGSKAIATKNILPVEDFEAKADSVVLRTKLIRLFIMPSNFEDKFFAVPGNKPLVNAYSYDGKLLKSSDLRSIPLLESYYKDLIDFHTFTGVRDTAQISSNRRQFMNITYFPSVISDDRDQIYFVANKYANMSEVITKKIPADSLKSTQYIVAVDHNKLTYRMYHLDVVQPLEPLKVIDNKLWSYDRRKSSILIFNLK